MRAAGKVPHNSRQKRSGAPLAAQLFPNEATQANTATYFAQPFDGGRCAGVAPLFGGNEPGYGRPTTGDQDFFSLRHSIKQGREVCPGLKYAYVNHDG